jgi:photosynthetic reaction center cytochrome c subunit
MHTIAGRENEPAGTVFKNVKILKDMPAGEFLKNMDVNYGRGLGMTCGNCHVIGQYDGDTRKNKRIARQMQEMTNHINTSQLPNVKELDEDYPKVTCVMCHMGSGHPKNTMAVPPPPASLPGR